MRRHTRCSDSRQWQVLPGCFVLTLLSTVAARAESVTVGWDPTDVTVAPAVWLRHHSHRRPSRRNAIRQRPDPADRGAVRQRHPVRRTAGATTCCATCPTCCAQSTATCRSRPRPGCGKRITALTMPARCCRSIAVAPRRPNSGYQPDLERDRRSSLLDSSAAAGGVGPIAIEDDLFSNQMLKSVGATLCSEMGRVRTEGAKGCSMSRASRERIVHNCSPIGNRWL